MQATDHSLGLTQERLKGLLRYDPETGAFSYPPSRRKPNGRPAGCARGNGYWFIRIAGRAYYAHRLAWLYMTGEWPSEFVDHINADKADNRWSNLRQASNAQNIQNRPFYGNRAGLKGAHFVEREGVYASSIRVNGKLKYLGRFITAQAANAAYEAAAKHHFGEYARSA